MLNSLIQSLLRRFGLRLTRLASNRGPDYGSAVLFSTLRRLGFSPRLIIDIGANHGNWTRAALEYFPDADYVLIEPQGYLRVHVQDLIDAGKKIRWINTGVADRTGKMRLYTRDRDDSSTFLRPNEELQARIVSDAEVEVMTLDDVVLSYKLPLPDTVKIDAEGLDLEVMRGASSLIGRTDVFLLEAGVICPFENSVGRVICTMEHLGYQLMDITELNRSPKHGVLWLTELAFVRRSSHLLGSATTSYD